MHVPPWAALYVGSGNETQVLTLHSKPSPQPFPEFQEKKMTQEVTRHDASENHWCRENRPWRLLAVNGHPHPVLLIHFRMDFWVTVL